MKTLILGALCSLSVLAATGRIFEENRGQAGPEGRDVQFLARDRGRQVFFTSNEVVWSNANGPALRLQFPGASGKAVWQPAGNAVGTISYFSGNDRSQWVHAARQFERITWHGLYPGVDAVFYWHGERLEYDLVLAPGADASAIRVHWRGGKSTLASDGSIIVAGGLLKQLAPVIYQGQRRIEGHFVANGDAYRVTLGNYDQRQALVIDPVLELSTYLGGENDDAVTVVADGFVAGTTASVRFPGNTATRRRSRDIFVRGTGTGAPNVNQPIGTIVIGGSGDEELGGAHYMSALRSLVIGGTTRSADFAPFSAGGQTLSGPSDAFIATIGFTGFSGPTVSSIRIFGGSGEDRILSVSGGAFWFTYAGETTSSDLRDAAGTYAGGVDGFFGHSDLSRPTYLGGSADDRVLSISSVNYNTIVLGGETRSPDFPNLQAGSPGLQGPSDGFVTIATFASAGTPLTGETISAWLIGGSGEDRVTALTPSVFAYPFQQTPPSLAIAGTTTSPDLPTRNAAQPALAGASDAFAGIWTQGIFQWLTYIGGSATEEATGVARNGSGDVFVSGWTNSTDLKTVAPFQERNAGGEDAFYAVVAPNTVRSLTYFGGSGNDRANSLALVRDAVARLGGWTTSADLPLKNAWQDGRGEASEGFVVEIGSSYLYAVPLVRLAKDGAVPVTAKAAQAAPGLPITYRSSDPAKVMLTDGTTVAAEITAPLGQQVNAEGFAAEGEVDISISAPGFQPASTHVTLLPGVVVAQFSATALSTWSSPAFANANWSVIDPQTGQPAISTVFLPASFDTRTGFRVPAVVWSSSDQSVLRVAPSSSTVFNEASLQPVGPGVARIRIDAGGLPVWPPDGIDFRVTQPSLTVAGPHRLGRDLMSVLSFAFNGDQNAQSQQRRGMVTIRSEDPSKLLLSTDSTIPGVAALSVPLSAIGPAGSNIWAQALAGEGEVRLTISSPELSDTTVTVMQLERARVQWGGYSAASRKLEPVAQGVVGVEVPLSFQFESVSGVLASGLRPGVPSPTWRLTNSADSIVECNRVTVQPAAGSIRAFGLSPGSATLTLTPVNPSHFELGSATTRIDVAPPASVSRFFPPASAVTIGKDLQTVLQFRYTGTGALTVSSEDPSAVLLASTFRDPGQPTLALNRPLYSDELTFYLQGVKESGETDVVIRHPQGEHRIRVSLAPSGPSFRSTFPGSGFDQGYEVGLSALDDLTGAPLVSQLPVPGKSFPVQLRTTGAEVRLSRDSVTLDASSPSASVSLTLPALGEEAVLFAESAGRTSSQVLRRTPLNFRIPAPITLMRDTVASFDILSESSSNLPEKVTVTSSDPEAVLLSLRPDEAGKPSIEWPALNQRGPIYLHGLKASGAATIQITAPGFAAAEVPVSLANLRVRVLLGRFAGPRSVSIERNQSLAGQVLIAANAIRPGAGPFRYRLRTTNPTAVSVSPESVQFTGETLTVPFTLTGAAPGAAELLLEGEPAVVANGLLGYIVSSTAAPAEQVTELTLGANAQSTTIFSLNSNNPNGAIATVTSSDPTRVLVSRSASAQGSGTVTLAIQPGAASATFYLQALQSTGEVIITATTPGFAEQRWRVRLTPSWFAPVTVNGNSRLEVGQSRALAPTLQWAGSDNRTAQLRPGLGPLRIGVTSSNSSVVKLAENSLTIGDGASPQIASVSVQALAVGVSLISFDQPAGFGPALPGQESLQLAVAARTLTFGCGQDAAVLLGRDMQVACYSPGESLGAVVQAVSTDPSRLLLSTDPLKLGESALTINPTGQARLVLQSLAASGTVEVVFSAPGYDDLRVPVVLRRSEVVPSRSAFALQKGRPDGLELVLAIASGGSLTGGTRPARPGSSIRVGGAATPAGIIAVEGPAVFAPNSDRAVLILRGDAVGTALLELTNPDGFISPNLQPVTVSVQ